VNSGFAERCEWRRAGELIYCRPSAAGGLISALKPRRVSALMLGAAARREPSQVEFRAAAARWSLQVLDARRSTLREVRRRERQPEQALNLEADPIERVLGQPESLVIARI